MPLHAIHAVLFGFFRICLFLTKIHALLYYGPIQIQCIDTIQEQDIAISVDIPVNNTKVKKVPKSKNHVT